MVYRFGCLIVALRAVLVLLIITGSSLAHAIDSERWPTLKQNYFGDRSIATNSQIISLEAPKRAHDAATVPVVIKAMDKGRQIKEVYFAVGVLDNGELHMAERFVKASGGCSAPALADMDAAIARAGKMKLFLNEINSEKQYPRSEAVIKISHPNNSGMQFDQISRNYIPAYFVNTITAQLDNVDVMNIETNFSMSENPVVRIAFDSEATVATNLKVIARDSKGNVYSDSIGSD